MCIRLSPLAALPSGDFRAYTLLTHGDRVLAQHSGWQLIDSKTWKVEAHAEESIG